MAARVCAFALVAAAGAESAIPTRLLASPGQSAAQARIAEQRVTLDIYPFSDPDPVPILATDRRLYPYHRFLKYSSTSEPREWKVVKMENDVLELFVLPEVGGKVWGAVVKETGHEFIYRNEVMKFRDIALRGPWTSGGIEFNFGVIGHRGTRCRRRLGGRRGRREAITGRCTTAEGRGADRRRQSRPSRTRSWWRSGTCSRPGESSGPQGLRWPSTSHKIGS